MSILLLRYKKQGVEVMFDKELLIKAATVGVASFILVILQGSMNKEAISVDLNALIKNEGDDC